MQLQDTNLHYLLNQVGLTYNEAKVYLYLLNSGTRLGPEIYGDLMLDKSSCYRALKSLIEKNLVYKVGEERNQEFCANPSEHLETLVRHEEKKLAATKQALAQFQTTLKTHYKELYKNKNVTVITTEAGRRQYMESRLRCKSKLIRDLSGRSTSAVYYPDYDAYMADFIARRVKAGVFLRQLTPYGEIDDKWERTSPEMLKEARELPQDFIANASLGVWDDVVSLSSKDQGQQIGVMIHDPIIANLMISMYDFIWDTLSPNIETRKQ